VQVKGSSNAVSTNENGEFELKGIDENAIVVVSGVNIETYELKIAGRANLPPVVVKMKVGEMNAVEVTVNTGYQRGSRERSTGSFEVVNNGTIGWYCSGFKIQQEV
jgi:hypothetical protein